MGWYHRDWVFRAPLTINNHSGVNEPECEFTVPPAMGKFFDQVQSDFSDVRITRADGITALDFAFTGGTPSVANRACSIQVDNANHNVSTLYGGQSNAADAAVGAFMYWGNTDANLASGVNNSINIGNSPKVIEIDLTAPGSSSSNYVLQCYRPLPDQQYPNHRIRKQVADDVIIYWDLSSCVSKLARKSELSHRDEEIAYVRASIFDQDGADTTSAMCDQSRIMIGQNYTVAMPIRAGTHEKRYIIIMTFGLVGSSGIMRVLDQRATLLVENLGLHPS